MDKKFFKNIISNISELEEKRDALNHEIWVEKRKIKDIFVSKPGWDLFASRYCVDGDDYVNSIDDYVKDGINTSRSSIHLSISFEDNLVIINDYVNWGYDGQEDWTFEIPIDKFIEFCSCDDYMQKVIDRYIAIKKCREEREEREYAEQKELKEKELYEELKKKYGNI